MAKPIRYTPKQPSWAKNYAARSTARNRTPVKTAAVSKKPNWLEQARQRAASNAQSYQRNAAIPNAQRYTPQAQATRQNWLDKAKATWNDITRTVGGADWTGAMSTSPGIVTPPPNQYAYMATGNPIYRQDYASHFGNQYTAPRVNQTAQFMRQMYPTPGVRRTNTRNFAELPAYMRPGYVPGRNMAEDMPEKTYRKIFHQPMTVAMQTYPQGYADEAGYQPYSSGYGGYGGYGDYGYGGGLGGYAKEAGYTGPADWNRTKGYKPYSNDVPRWLQGLVTWRF